MTTKELTMIWAKIKALFAPKSSLTALETKVNNIIDANGKVKSDVLPSYVDDVIDGYYNMLDGKMYTYLSNCPEGEECTYTKQDIEISGEPGKIYYAVNDKKIYRFNEGTSRFFEIVDEPDLTNYLTKTEASNTYLTETQANNLYILQSEYIPGTTVTVESEVLENNNNPVSSGGVYTYLTNKYPTIVHAKYNNGNMYKISGYGQSSGIIDYRGVANDPLAPAKNTFYVDLVAETIYMWDNSTTGYIQLSGVLTQNDVNSICIL